jgi:sugar lactone lactonase YvrE
MQAAISSCNNYLPMWKKQVGCPVWVLLPPSMRKIIVAILILSLPSALALVAYRLFRTRSVPTDRAAVGRVSSMSGSGAPGTQDGRLQEASFSDPFGVGLDRRGNVIVADGGASNRIRRITPEGRVETLAGSAEGFADGSASEAAFNTPSGVAVAKDGAVLIADTSNNRIRRLGTDGRVSTLAGTGRAGYRDGPASNAEFDGPIGIAIDNKGDVLVGDSYNDCIRKISSDGTVSTVAGSHSSGFSDGLAGAASFDTPCGVAVDDEGTVFVADMGNHAVRKVATNGEVITVAGGPSVGGERYRSEQPNEQLLRRPVGIAVTHDGFLFVTDEEGGRILRIDPQGNPTLYAGGGTGFADADGAKARFNSPAGIAVDLRGNLFVADSQNYLIRLVTPAASEAGRTTEEPQTSMFIQPAPDGSVADQGATVPRLNSELLGVGQTLPWPVNPQDRWHEIAGVFGEARGAPGGIALDHLHSGVDVRGQMGEAAMSVLDEKVSSPIPNWDFDSSNEGIRVGVMSYIHIRVGRDVQNRIQPSEKFSARVDGNGKLTGIRVRRGARFSVGAVLGTLNRLNHVHLNAGPWNAEINPIQFPFAGFTDTVAPVIEPDGIEVLNASGERLRKTQDGRLLVSGDVQIVVAAYDTVNGNGPTRKLGLYRLGYELINEDGSPVVGFEEPIYNIQFNRMPSDVRSVSLVYAAGSGVSAYGNPTKFKYIVTNRVRDGTAKQGFLRTSDMRSGRYILRIIAEDYFGNRASGEDTELRITIMQPY